MCVTLLQNRRASLPLRPHAAHLQTHRERAHIPSFFSLSVSSLIIPITTEGINAALVDTKSLVKRAVYSLLFHKVMVAE